VTFEDEVIVFFLVPRGCVSVLKNVAAGHAHLAVPMVIRQRRISCQSLCQSFNTTRYGRPRDWSPYDGIYLGFSFTTFLQGSSWTDKYFLSQVCRIVIFGYGMIVFASLSSIHGI
jgi:hypothetical protein